MFNLRTPFFRDFRNRHASDRDPHGSPKNRLVCHETRPKRLMIGGWFWGICWFFSQVTASFGALPSPRTPDQPSSLCLGTSRLSDLRGVLTQQSTLGGTGGWPMASHGGNWAVDISVFLCLFKWGANGLPGVSQPHDRTAFQVGELLYIICP